MRIAIVHPWLIGNGGGERVIDALADLCPNADFFTLLLDPDTLSLRLRDRNIQASFLNRVPFSGRLYQHLMPFYHLASTSFDLRQYDLIISSGGPATKGVIAAQGARHIHYCHSPVRFLWDQFPAWQERLPAILKPVFTPYAHSSREWDFNCAQRVDEFIANSYFVGQRIHTYYRRNCAVIYPPVDTSSGYISETRDDYFVCVGRLVCNKRIDLLIRACNLLRINLRIVGEGPERRALESLAGDTITFMGRVDDASLSGMYAHARAFLFAAEEDFGIALVEAQSYGLPVIAYGKGGARETICDGGNPRDGVATGIFFEEQSIDSVCAAIYKFLEVESGFDPVAIQNHAKRFDTSVFMHEMHTAIYGEMRPEVRSRMPGRHANEVFAR